MNHALRTASNDAPSPSGITRRRLAALALLAAGTGAPLAQGALRADRRQLTVVFVGTEPVDADRFEGWLGRRVDGVLMHTGASDWNDWSGSIGWFVGRWKDTARPIFWSIPLIPSGASLQAAGRGEYDERYRAAAAVLAGSTNQDTIPVRTGWEFNGDWMPWAAAGRAGDFVAAFRRFVAAFRSVSERFVFEWAPNVGAQAMDAETAYPGDDVVDIIGMDFYYDPKWYPQDPDQAWAYMLQQPFGLQWHQRFAREHGKPTAYSEWGVALDSSGPYIAQAAAWFRAHDNVYQSYWNSDAAFAGKLSDGRLPGAGQAYRLAFGSGAR